METLALSAEGLARAFGGVRAVDGVSLELHTGHVTGLIGANGAGKSTLVNLLTGSLYPDNGRVQFLGRDVTRWSPAKRSRAGMSRTFQHPRLVPNLTVLENVMLGAVSRQARAGDVFAFLRPAHGERDVARRSMAALVQVGLPRDRWMRIPKQISPQEWLWVEVARALASSPSLVLLDEPNTGFTASETATLVTVLRDIVTAGSVGALIITHDVSLAMRVCDQIYVLDHGALIAQGAPSEIVDDPQVITAYLGRKGRNVAQETLRELERS
jgi:branched-chain amino acid transport system ATP-binding protein